MTTLFAPRALLPDRWAEDVRVTFDQTGRIVSVEPNAPVRAGDETLEDRVLVPALANVHSHAFQRAMAGLAEVRARGRESFWSWRDLMYRFVERLDPDHIEAVTALVQVEMLEAGYASVGEFHYLHHQRDGTPYADVAETARRICAAAEETGIGLTLLPVFYAHGGPNAQPLADGQLRFGCDIERYARLLDAAEVAIAGLSDDARLGVAPHSLRAVTPQLLREAVSLRTGAPIHIHIAEQTREVDEIEAWLGARPVTWLLDNVPVDARWCLVHATHASPAEIEAVARTGAVAGLCPMTEANLGDGIFDAARFLAAGGEFGIGSDSNVRVALAEELRLLEYGQRLRDRERCVLAGAAGSTGARLFRVAAAGGARALGRDSGEIRPGFWADLAALDAGSLALFGRHGDALLDGWLFSGDDSLVTELWAAGRKVVEAGRHVRRAPIEARYRAALGQLLGDM